MCHSLALEEHPECGRRIRLVSGMLTQLHGQLNPQHSAWGPAWHVRADNTEFAQHNDVVWGIFWAFCK